MLECETHALKDADAGRISAATSETDISNRNLVGSSSSSNAC